MSYEFNSINEKNKEKSLGPIWNFFCHHSLLLTQFSSLITRYSSLKIPNSLHHTRLATDFNTHHSNISTLLWVQCLSWVSDHSVIPTVPLPFTPSTKCLSHHSLPLLLAPKKSKLKKLKQRAKHRKQALASVTCKADAVALCVTCDSISTWPTHSSIATIEFRWSLSLLRRVDHQIERSAKSIIKSVGWSWVYWVGWSWVYSVGWSWVYWVGFGEAATARERVAAMEDEVLWSCGWTCLWVWNPFLWPCK